MALYDRVYKQKDIEMDAIGRDKRESSNRLVCCGLQRSISLCSTNSSVCIYVVSVVSTACLLYTLWAQDTSLSWIE